MNKSLYSPVKELGQNFLTDSASVDKMVRALDLSPKDTVIEIGPGLGVLTETLLEHLTSEEANLIAVEIDQRFVNKLQDMFIEKRNVQIVESNILDWLPTYNPQKPFKLIGSLPYYITSPIVHEIIQMRERPVTAVLLIQKEVAERIYNTSPDSTYLSVLVHTFFDVEYVGKIDKKHFSPEPSVDGGILKLQKKDSPIPHESLRRYMGFLHKGFSNPRKMLNKVFTKNELALVQIDPGLRPQNLDVDKWVELYRRILV